MVCDRKGPLPQKPHMFNAVMGVGRGEAQGSATALLNCVWQMWGTVNMFNQVCLVHQKMKYFFINLSTQMFHSFTL
jgi:hypothetical protein